MRIAKSIFPDADNNIVKNNEQAIDSNVLPEQTAEMIKFYIQQLKAGFGFTARATARPL